MVATVVDTILQNAGATAELRQTVGAQMGEIEFIDGRVIDIDTRQASKNIVVGRPGTLVGFLFPPNIQAFSAELTRAQDDNLSVTVTYRKNAQNVNIIIGVQVYGHIGPT